MSGGVPERGAPVDGGMRDVGGDRSLVKSVRIRLTFVLASTLPAVACTDTASLSAGLMVDGLERSRIAAVTDTTGPFLHYPLAMAVWRDSLAVADMRGSQVVLLSRSLDGGRAFGRSGEGPDELASPQGVVAAGERLAVFDRGNGRVTWFGPDGRATDARDLMIPSVPTVSFAALDEGMVLMPTASPDHYAVIDSAGVGREVFRRPDGLLPLDDSPVTSNMVVGSLGGTFMVDAENGVVGRVIGSDLVDVDSLPPLLRDDAEATVAELAAPERRVTPIFAAGPAPDGIVVWLIGKNDPAGAIWTASGEWIPIRLARDAVEDFPTYPSDVLVWGEELFVLTAEGIRVYRLARVEEGGRS